MAEYDMVIRGGTIVDGTGIPSHKADLAIKDGRVAKISGRIPAGGAKEIDASGCIVAPGAIDLHTHYDAQLNWDPYATLSGWFGVTSLTIGQCGFGFAPTRAADRDLNMRMMNRIEAIPLESMRQGLRWDWETFPEYMDSLDKQGLGVNVGALVPFSPLRGYVLGMIPARERTSVNEAELNQMKQIMHDGMKAGAFGISADANQEDRCEDGRALPSHVASKEEFIAMAEIMGDFGVGHIGWTLGLGHDEDTLSDYRELLAQMARVSGRPLHFEGGNAPADWFESARAEGLNMILQEVCMEVEAEFTLAEYNLFDYMPNWVNPLVGSAEERAAKLRDPAVRAGMKADVDGGPAGPEGNRMVQMASDRTDWTRFRVMEVANERNHNYEGMSIAQIADQENKHPVDALLDLALDEDLQTEFIHLVAFGDEKKVEQAIMHPYGHISVSDGGAHTRYLTVSTWPIYFLSHWIRDRQLMSVEAAHQKMSAFPAWFTDFKNRGTLRLGDWADVIVYNMDELGLLYERPIFDTDFPGGERRLIQKPTGLRYTLVNGEVTFEGNDCTGALPGKLLRSYDMVS